jgi:hypothetical protein
VSLLTGEGSDLNDPRQRRPRRLTTYQWYRVGDITSGEPRTAIPGRDVRNPTNSGPQPTLGKYVVFGVVRRSPIDPAIAEYRRREASGRHHDRIVGHAATTAAPSITGTCETADVLTGQVGFKRMAENDAVNGGTEYKVVHWSTDGGGQPIAP